MFIWSKFEYTLVIYLMYFMQRWFISNVENLQIFSFQDSSMKEKLNKNSIYLKYNFCNNILYRSKAWGQYFYLFLKEISFYSARIC